jgi:hypothetical protein
LRGEGEDVYVGVLHELLLDAGRGDVDEVTVSYDKKAYVRLMFLRQTPLRTPTT